MTVGLAEGLRKLVGVRKAAPLLLLEGTAVNADTGAAAPHVQVLGVPAEFLTLYEGTGAAAPSGREVLLSDALAADLKVGRGDAILLHVARPDALHVDSLFARRKLTDRIRTYRLDCSGVVPQEGAGGFSLGFETGARRTVLVDYGWLAAQIGLTGRCHAIALETTGAVSTTTLNRAVADIITPEDLDLKLTAADGGLLIRSGTVTFTPEMADALVKTARRLNAAAETGSIMLTTRVASAEATDGRRPEAHYVVAGYSPSVPVRDGEVVLSRWLAADIGAVPGMPIALEWMEPSEDGAYPIRQAEARATRIIPTELAAQERWMVPEFAGITDARRISDWDPPFPVDMRLVTQRDEEYWDRYRAAPRVFVSQNLMLRMWKARPQRPEWITAMRLAIPKSGGPTDAVAAFTSALRQTPEVLRAGPTVRNLREEAVAASQGSSDFRGLMVGMSMFLVASALGLSASMMRLSAERRASQTGLLLAMGFTPRAAAAPLVIEGAIASLIGAIVGALPGIAIAGLLVQGLNTWWSGAVARATIRLTVSAADIAAGVVATGVLGIAAAWWTASRLTKRDTLLLLAGWRAVQVTFARVRGGAFIGWTVLAVASVAVAAIGHSSAEAFLAAGAGLLVSGLGLLHAGLGRMIALTGGPPSPTRIALRNAALHGGHSTLTAGMVAAAAFIVVTVAANVRSPASLDVRDLRSGAGGFDLVVRSTVPLPVSLETPEGRRRLGFSADDERLFKAAEIVPLWMSGGVNTGCLNLARPTEPRVLGVTPEFIRRGGFTVETGVNPGGNPWTLLTRATVGGVIPAFGDAESVRWILHSGLGRTLTRRTGTGTYVLRFDGLVRFSVFAGELLVSEENFRRMFPEVTAPSMFLIRVGSADEVGPMAEALRRNLGEAGVEVRTTRDVLSELLAVQNTYLAAFLLLGGLGVVLGMAGLGAVMLRAAGERRPEFAIMAALGFRRSDLRSMLVRESAGLLLFGTVLGACTALVASLPRIASGEAAINWLVVCLVLLGAVAAGLASCWAAANAALRGDVLAALRWE
jgi:ABC-type lipoprotein release transport system permease subunit